MARIGLPGPTCRHGPSSGLLHGAFLLPGGKGLVQLAVDEEVAQDATGAPSNAVGPSFDPRGVLLVDEDAPTAHEMSPLPVVRATRHMVQDAGQTGLEEQQSILGGCDVAVESGLQHGGPVHHDCRESVERGKEAYPPY